MICWESPGWCGISFHCDYQEVWHLLQLRSLFCSRDEDQIVKRSTNLWGSTLSFFLSGVCFWDCNHGNTCLGCGSIWPCTEWTKTKGGHPKALPTGLTQLLCIRKKTRFLFCAVKQHGTGPWCVSLYLWKSRRGHLRLEVGVVDLYSSKGKGLAERV